jgi:hypothetical protein
MEYFCNVLLTTVAFYLFFYIGAMGAGDVKLLGVCAGYFSGEKVLCFLFFALLFAAVFALCKMYLARNLWDRLCYLGEYVWDVVRCGRWKAYFAEERAHPASGICPTDYVPGTFCKVQKLLRIAARKIENRELFHRKNILHRHPGVSRHRLPWHQYKKTDRMPLSSVKHCKNIP